MPGQVRGEFGVGSERSAADETALDDRPGGLVAHDEVRSGLGSVASEFGVEHVTSQGDRVVGKSGMLRPRHVDLVAPVDHAHTVETVPVQSERVDVEQRQLVQRTGRQRVAARLVTRNGTLLDDRDVVARTGQPVSDRRSGGATADDEDVGVQQNPLSRRASRRQARARRG